MAIAISLRQLLRDINVSTYQFNKRFPRTFCNFAAFAKRRPDSLITLVTIEHIANALEWNIGDFLAYNDEYWEGQEETPACRA